VPTGRARERLRHRAARTTRRYTHAGRSITLKEAKSPLDG
jgi:hypothetical protein